MKRKTEEKLRRRFLALPLHHIDTSILLEPENTENGKFCQKYLQKISYNFRSKVSLPVLGELMLKTIKLKTPVERYTALDIISSWIQNQKIDFCVPKNTSEIINQIKSLDNRLEETDTEIYACAFEDNAITLVTLDQEMISNEILEQKFEVKIRHPKELV